MFVNSHVMVHNPYPFLVSGLRIFLAGFALLALHAIQHKRTFLKQIQALWCRQFIAYALCLYTFSATSFSWAVQYIDPVKGCFLFVMAPFITALMLFFGYGEKLSVRKIVGLKVGLAAVVPIVLASNHGIFKVIPPHLEALGYIVFLLAVTGFSYGWILKKQLLAVVHVPTTLLTGGALFCGGLTTLLVGFIAHGSSLWHVPTSNDFWIMILLFVAGTAFCYNLYGLLLKRYSPTFLSFAGFLEPAFGLLFGVFLFGQAVSPFSLFALVILGLGLFLFYQEELRIG